MTRTSEPGHELEHVGRVARMPPTTLLAIGLTGLVVFGPLDWLPRALSAEPVQFSIAIEGRKVDAKQATIRAMQGQVLELAFTADEIVELHLHGYDQYLTVQPGSVAVLRLHAKIAGRFAIEGHRFGGGAGAGQSRRHVVLLYIEIHPR